MFTKLRDASVPQQAQYASAAEANTRESFSAVAAFRFDQRKGGIQEQMKAALEMANEQRVQLIESGRTVERLLEQMARSEGSDF